MPILVIQPLSLLLVLRKTKKYFLQYIGYLKLQSHLTGSVNVTRIETDRKIAAESYPVMKVVPAADRGSRDRCMECMKRTMTARLPDMYKKINGQLTDITVRVTDK